MENNHIKPALLNSIITTMELMAFFEVTEIETFDDSFIEDAFWSKLTFKNKSNSYTFLLVVPEVFAREITAQIYADGNPVLENSIVIDAVSELNNTIAGQFILNESIITIEDPYTLSIPKTGLNTPSPIDLEDKNTQYLQVHLDERFSISTFIIKNL